ncbi:hypothetical protein GF326_10760 [Candidatus Bathyarchaeota archaeon]|nr:hypothetical protein [Candidatus Bathyarchaeota archaeon]
MGRIIKDSKRTRIHNQMKELRRYYRAALKDNDLQDAFDEVWRDWDSETGAMVYSQVISPMDLLCLTGIISNRKEIMRLKERLREHENRGVINQI